MSPTIQTPNRGLDASVPTSGRAADAYEVAVTTTYLYHPNRGEPLAAARHAVALHVISGRLHRLAERQCNEDLTCRGCAGDGSTRTYDCGDMDCPQKPWLGPVVHGSSVNISGEKQPDCPTCGKPARYAEPKRACRSCAGHGTTIGRRLERLRADATAIAEHYGLRVYFQTDPRGCSLYLIDPAIIPTPRELVVSGAYRYPSDPPDWDQSMTARVVDRWIEANYTRGHAVVRLGR